VYECAPLFVIRSFLCDVKRIALLLYYFCFFGYYTAGHMSAALDNNRMLVFGGKGKGGHVFGDTWIYYRDVNQWQLVQNNEVWADYKETLFCIVIDCNTQRVFGSIFCIHSACALTLTTTISPHY